MSGQSEASNVFSLGEVEQTEYRVKNCIKWFGRAETCLVFGIEAYQQGQCIASYDEVSIDYERVKRFVELCNTHRASFVHLPELIHDYFYFG